MGSHMLVSLWHTEDSHINTDSLLRFRIQTKSDHDEQRDVREEVEVHSLVKHLQKDHHCIANLLEPI